MRAAYFTAWSTKELRVCRSYVKEKKPTLLVHSMAAQTATKYMK